MTIRGGGGLGWGRWRCGAIRTWGGSMVTIHVAVTVGRRPPVGMGCTRVRRSPPVGLTTRPDRRLHGRFHGGPLEAHGGAELAVDMEAVMGSGIWMDIVEG